MSRSKFKLASLFSGAGGIDLGFSFSKRFHLSFANDILSSAAQTYAHNFHHQVVASKDVLSANNHPLYLVEDVNEVNFEAVPEKSPDVVIGGPPCQDFSVVRGPAKKRQGIDVKRGRLYAHFIRALIHLQPKVFVFENVPGIKSANKGVAYRTIVEDFSNLNLRWADIRKIVGNSFVDSIKNYFIVFSDIVDSANLGVPQRRKRLIIIGVREDLSVHDWAVKKDIVQKAQNILLGKRSLFKKYPLTPLEVFEGATLPELDGTYKQIMKEYKGMADLVGTDKAQKWEKNVWRKLTFDVMKDYFTLNSISPVGAEEVDKAFEEHAKVLKKLGYYKKRVKEGNFSDKSNRTAKESEEVLARLQMIPPDENHLFVKGTRWEVEGRGLSLIYRRLHPLKPSCTVVAHGGGGTWGYHYKRYRSRLTSRERARLQTFPDWFFFKGKTAEVRAQIGEAVPPLLGEKIAKIVGAILDNCW